MIEKGRPWERPATGPAEWHVEGDDAALAASVRAHPGARVGFRPDATSDLARALGIHASPDPDAEGMLELAVDALRVTADGRDLFAVNMVVVGTAPDRLRLVQRRRRPAGRGRRPGGARRPPRRPWWWRAGSTCVASTSSPGAIRATVGPRSRSTRCPAGNGVRSAPACRRASTCPHPDITPDHRASTWRSTVATGRLRLEVDGVPAPAATRVTRRRRARGVPDRRLTRSGERQVTFPAARGSRRYHRQPTTVALASGGMEARL